MLIRDISSPRSVVLFVPSSTVAELKKIVVLSSSGQVTLVLLK
jgi:hypothetical protein